MKQNILASLLVTFTGLQGTFFGPVQTSPVQLAQIDPTTRFWNLKRVDTSGKFDTAFVFPAGPPIRWQDWLIYSTDEKISGYNLVTNKTKDFTDKSQLALPPGATDSWVITNLRIIGNTLYFKVLDISSISTGRPNGNIYFLDFPGGSAKLLADKPFDLKFMHGRYWLIHGGAGRGAEFDLFYELNPITKEIKEIIATRENFGLGTRFIGINDTNFFIRNTTTTNGATISFVQASIDAPTSTKVLFEDKQFPNGIGPIKYFDENNTFIFLSGKDVYVFDVDTLSSKKLFGLTELSDGPVTSFGAIGPTSVCINNLYVIDSESEKLEQRFCKVIPEFRQKTTDELESEVQEKLNLPPGYKITFEKVQ